MHPSEKYRLLDELEWHVDDPKAALELMTDDEIRDVLRRGFMSESLSKTINARLMEERA